MLPVLVLIVVCSYKSLILDSRYPTRDSIYMLLNCKPWTIFLQYRSVFYG
jgi:hypothetical protein